MWSDSVNYAFGAKSYASTGEVLGWSDDPLTLWPPGLSVVLGSLIRLGIDLETAAVGLNAICVVASVLLTYRLARISLHSILLGLLAAMLFSVSAATIGIFSWLASEPPFVALTLLTLVIGTQACVTGRLHVSHVVALSLVVSVATTVRYAGAWLIPVAVLAAFLSLWPTDRRRALLMGLLTGALSSAGLVAVATRNLSLGAPPLGERFPSPFPAPSIFVGSAATVGRYVVPSGWTLAAVATGLVIAGLLVYALVVSCRRRCSAVMVIAFFVALYWALLTYSQLTTSTSPSSARFSAPVFSSMLILSIYAVRDIRSRILDSKGSADVAPFRRTVVATAIGSVVCFTVVVSAVQGIGYVEQARSKGLGYNSLKSRMSPLAASLSTIPEGKTVAATDDAKAAWVSQRRGIVRIPRQDGASADAFEDRTRTFVEEVNQGEWTHLAFFTDTDFSSLGPEELMRLGARLQLVATFDDGSLWEAQPVS